MTSPKADSPIFDLESLSIPEMGRMIKLGQVKKYSVILQHISQNPAEAAKLHKQEWKSLEDAIANVPPPGNPTLWAEVQSLGLLQTIAASFEQVFRADKQGDVAQNLLSVLIYACSAYYSLEPQIPEDEDPVKYLSETMPPIIKQWWHSYRNRLVDWTQHKGMFESRTNGLITLIWLSLSRGAPSTPEQQTLMRKTVHLMQSVPMRECALAFILLPDPEQPIFRTNAPVAAMSYAMGDRIVREGVIPGPITGFSTFSSDAFFVERRFRLLVDAFWANPDTSASLLAQRYFNIAILIDSLADMPDFGPTLRKHNGLWDVIIGTYWDWYHRWNMSAFKSRESYAFVSLIGIFALLCDGPRASQRLKVAIEKHDLLSIVAKGLVYWTRNTSNEPRTVKRWTTFVLLCQNNHTVVLAGIRKCDFIATLNAIRAQKGPDIERSVGIWNTLGKIGGLDEGRLLAEAFAKRKAIAGGLVGCSWHKCPMFRQESDRLMHWCIGCKKAVYCGYFCADGDWNDGHQTNCPATQALTLSPF